jgi:putative flippase GtrA
MIMTCCIYFWNANIILASSIGFACAVPIHFVIQRNFVFRVYEKSLQRFLIYFFVTVIMGLLNVFVLSILLYFYDTRIYLSQLTSTSVIFFINYYLNRFITFN